MVGFKGFIRRGVFCGFVAVLVLVLAGVSSAFGASSWWHLSSGARPSYLAPEGKGQIVLSAANLGYGGVDGEATPVVIADKLPKGLTASAIEFRNGNVGSKLGCVLGSLTCTFAGGLGPYSQIEVVISVEVMPGASSGELNTVSVSGGETPSVTVERPVVISAEATPFGLQDNELALQEEGGVPDTQAGSHPFQLTDTLVFNQKLTQTKVGDLPVPVALPKDVNVKLPPGLVGNPTPIARCSLAQFFTINEQNENACAPQTAVGVATVLVNEPTTAGMKRLVLPVFNLEPSFGEPARFGFFVTESQTPVLLDPSLRGGPGSGEEYALTLSLIHI